MKVWVAHSNTVGNQWNDSMFAVCSTLEKAKAKCEERAESEIEWTNFLGDPDVLVGVDEGTGEYAIDGVEVED
jgi:hypothetical protein